MPISLLSNHSRTISRINEEIRTSENLYQGYMRPAFIDDTKRLFRIVELTDRGCNRRRQWLSDVLNCDQVFVHNQSTGNYLCQARQTFSILLISGDDLPRVLKIVREMRNLLPGKAVVPVLSRSTAETATTLLQRGAADVLDSNMLHAEAAARLHALARRIDWTKRSCPSELRISMERDGKIKELTDCRLTPMENRILAVLSDNEDRLVSYPQLSTYMNKRASAPQNSRTLHIIICRLRQKLKHHVKIRTLWGKGYILSCKQVRGNEPQFTGDAYLRFI